MSIQISTHGFVNGVLRPPSAIIKLIPYARDSTLPRIQERHVAAAENRDEQPPRSKMFVVFFPESPCYCGKQYCNGVWVNLNAWRKVIRLLTCKNSPEECECTMHSIQNHLLEVARERHPSWHGKGVHA